MPYRTVDAYSGGQLRQLSSAPHWLRRITFGQAGSAEALLIDGDEPDWLCERMAWKRRLGIEPSFTRTCTSCTPSPTHTGPADVMLWCSREPTSGPSDGSPSISVHSLQMPLLSVRNSTVPRWAPFQSKPTMLVAMSVCTDFAKPALATAFSRVVVRASRRDFTFDAGRARPVAASDSTIVSGM